MPLICGPKNSRYTFTGSPCPHLDLAYEISAKTLSEAIFAYESRFDVRILPYFGMNECTQNDEPKYFEFIEIASGRMQLVDIHVHRQGIEICPKQDLTFRLLQDDLVEIGELIC